MKTYIINTIYMNGTGNSFTIEASSKESALHLAKQRMFKLLNKYNIVVTAQEM